ncbi:MAG: hypothetical protein M1828_002317 [Chrysothrix sp. TS-e1954]|nr:MAG: hypothetical protein M1828_002317 [Chrysothrix sp. TS-e1954]
MASKRKRETPPNTKPSKKKAKTGPPKLLSMTAFRKSTKPELEALCVRRALQLDGTKSELVDALLKQQDNIGDLNPATVAAIYDSTPAKAPRRRLLTPSKPSDSVSRSSTPESLASHTSPRTPASQGSLDHFRFKDPLAKSSEKKAVFPDDLPTPELTSASSDSYHCGGKSERVSASLDDDSVLGWARNPQAELAAREIDVGNETPDNHFMMLRLLHFEIQEFLQCSPDYSPQLQKMVDILIRKNSTLSAEGQSNSSADTADLSVPVMKVAQGNPDIGGDVVHGDSGEVTQDFVAASSDSELHSSV